MTLRPLTLWDTTDSGAAWGGVGSERDARVVGGTSPQVPVQVVAPHRDSELDVLCVSTTRSSATEGFVPIHVERSETRCA